MLQAFPVGQDHLNPADIRLSFPVQVRFLGVIDGFRDVMDIAGQALRAAAERDAEVHVGPGQVHHLVEASGKEVTGDKGPQDLLADHFRRRLPLSGHGHVVVFGGRGVDAQDAQPLVGGIPGPPARRSILRIRVPGPAGLGPRVEIHARDLLGPDSQRRKDGQDGCDDFLFHLRCKISKFRAKQLYL